MVAAYCFYGNLETAKRHESWFLLKSIKDMSHLPWVAIGDFNELVGLCEKEGGGNRPAAQMISFLNDINWCGFRDLGFVGPKFTWLYQRKDGTQIRERLDRALATEDWKDKFPSAKLYHLSSSVLDHCPLSLHLFGKAKKEKFPHMFKFESMWLKDQRCEELVNRARDDGRLANSDFPLVNCLDLCRSRLVAWNKNEFGHVGKKIKSLQRHLEWVDFQSTSPAIIEDIRNTRVELNCWLDKEDTMLLQRSRINWFQDGDQNTRFFHSKASTRYQKNFISGVMDSNDCWQEDMRKVEEIVINYYSNLFSSSNPSQFTELIEAVEPKVSQDMNNMLTRDFQGAEVKAALNQMYPLKAPGLDGMPPVFFQHFRAMVGNEVVRTVLDFLNSGISPPHFHDTHIVLIPKNKEPQRITDYKLASKAIANRLQKVLPSIISDSQSAFIQGRLITDNVLIAFETMHHINQKKVGKKGEMAIKLDTSKAYDRVEWRCL